MAGAARFAAPRVLPWLGRMFRGAQGFARKMWSGNAGTTASPIYDLGSNGAARLGLKGALNSPTAKGIGYGMLGNEAINQFSGPAVQQQNQAQATPQHNGRNQTPEGWVNPFTSAMNS